MRGNCFQVLRIWFILHADYGSEERRITGSVPGRNWWIQWRAISEVGKKPSGREWYRLIIRSSPRVVLVPPHVLPRCAPAFRLPCPFWNENHWLGPCWRSRRKQWRKFFRHPTGYNEDLNHPEMFNQLFHDYKASTTNTSGNHPVASNIKNIDSTWNATPSKRLREREWYKFLKPTHFSMVNFKGYKKMAIQRLVRNPWGGLLEDWE